MHKIAAGFLCILHNERVFADPSNLWDTKRVFADLSNLWDTKHLFELPRSCPKKWTERMFVECGAQEP